MSLPEKSEMTKITTNDLTTVRTEMGEGQIVVVCSYTPDIQTSLLTKPQAPRKNFTTLSTLSLAATLMATWEAMLSTMGAGLVSGGPVSLVYGFIRTQALALSLPFTRKLTTSQWQSWETSPRPCLWLSQPQCKHLPPLPTTPITMLTP